MNLYYYRAGSAPAEARTLDADLCVVGATAAGVAAAVAATRLGRTAVLIEHGGAVGGMTAGGLSMTDIGNKRAIGGLSREFYRRCGAHYGEAEEWRFEPHVASAVLADLLAEAGVTLFTRQPLAGVEMDGQRITSITTEGGLTVRARMFLDTSYEGDLLARAGVSYTVGRESNAQYGETLNGVQIHPTHQFDLPVDPYITPGDPASGLLPGIEAAPAEPPGTGDHRVQAYNFRLCLTRAPGNRISFEKPDGYDRREYELLARYFAAGWGAEVFRKFDPIRGEKVDMNNHGGLSSDFIGRNYAYPEASYAERERIFQAHVTYQQGYMWFMANDPAVPPAIRERWAEWGLAADEFTATGGWPHQLYVREARRMLGDYVMTEHDCRGATAADDVVALAAYTMDSHNCRRFVRDGRVWNEGDVQVAGFPPYPISYRAIVPRRGECENLLVPVCLSSSHIAYGSIRMEPVFMILGQSAAAAANLAIAGGCAVQDVPYSQLREQLQRDGQVLSWDDLAGELGEVV
ncbi:xanthan lyase [Kouleothrix aurantiaca]|uniref:Xanthan lyase n=1 Tax=Kouleothrix aurantiaca TaxID=186479 RepID=A0A0N8PS90_9CHLR|nr:xanthan lyase [Kouleothrix aurantiaca]